MTFLYGMAENNLPHIVRWESTKPPYAEPLVRWCGRSVNAKVGGKCLLWLAFTSYPIVSAMIESFAKKYPIPSQKQYFWGTQTSSTSQRFVIINGNSITDAIVVFFIFFLFTLAILYEATGYSLNQNLIAITAKLQLVFLWFVWRMSCGFFYHLLIVVKVKEWSRVG